MKYSAVKRICLLILSFVILSVFIIGCGAPTADPNDGIDNIVAATLTAVAEDQLRIEAHVAETVAAMPVAAQEEKVPAIEEDVAEPEQQDPTATPLPPTAEPTATAESTDMAEASSIPQIRMAEQAQAINVRRGPNICFDVVAILNEAMIASIIGRDTPSIWYKIELANGGSGWIWSENIEPLESDIIDQIPTTDSALKCATPTPLPTIEIPATVQASEPQKPPSSSNPTSVPTGIPPTSETPPTPEPPDPCGDPYPYC